MSSWSEQVGEAQERLRKRARWDETPWGVREERALQLQLGSLGPSPGSVWRNVHTGELATVLGVSQRRYCWVQVRGEQGERERRLGDWERDWRPAADDRL